MEKEKMYLWICFAIIAVSLIVNGVMVQNQIESLNEKTIVLEEQNIILQQDLDNTVEAMKQLGLAMGEQVKVNQNMVKLIDLKCGG